MFFLGIVHGNAEAQSVYTVLPGDTHSRIARHFGVTLTELRYANPGVDEALSPGDQLTIPTRLVLPELPSDTAWDMIDSLVHHTVEQGETLYRIAARYGKLASAIRAVNPGLTTALVPGQKIRIPGEYTAPGGDEWIAIRQDLLKRGSGSSTPFVRDSDTLNVLAMLPFMLSTDTIVGGDYDAKTLRLREVALEFTHGLEWGGHLLKKAGLHVRLRQVDTEPDSLGVVAWTDADLNWADVVFGPLRRSVLDSVAGILAGRNVPQWTLISQPERMFGQYPHLIGLEPDEAHGMEMLGAYVAEQHPMDTVLVLETHGKDAALERAFRKGFTEYRGSDSGLVSMPVTSRFAEGLTLPMDTSKLNVLAIPSGSSARSMFAYVQSELQSADSFPVQLFANASALQYDFVEWKFANRVRLTAPSSEWMDWADERTVEKLAVFRDHFETDPASYELRSCDALIETVRWLPNSPSGLEPIQHRFTWRLINGRLENTAWRLIRLEEGEVMEVKIAPKKDGDIQ